MIKALHQHVTPREKVVQDICYIAAQNRLDIIQWGEPLASHQTDAERRSLFFSFLSGENHQRKTSALCDLTLRYQTSAQGCIAMVLFPLLHSRLQAIEQAAAADCACLL